MNKRLPQQIGSPAVLALLLSAALSQNVYALTINGTGSFTGTEAAGHVAAFF